VNAPNISLPQLSSGPLGAFKEDTMNIANRSSSFVIIVSFMLSLPACEPKSDAPTAPSSKKIAIDTTIVRFDSLGSIGGPGFYYKNCSWQGGFNPYRGDSIVRALLDSNFMVDEFWYPQAVSPCLDPRIHEREIVKLSQPDTTIYRFAYAPLDTGYADVCIRSWRHYKVRRTGGA